MKAWDDRSSEYRANQTPPPEPARGCGWILLAGLVWVAIFVTLAILVAKVVQSCPA